MPDYSEFEETVWKQTVEGHRGSGCKLIHNLRDAFNNELQVTGRDRSDMNRQKRLDAAHRRMDPTWKPQVNEFQTHLATIETRTRCKGSSNAGTSAVVVKPPKFDGSSSWAGFHRQIKAVDYHNGWAGLEKAKNLLSILQGQSTDILHSVPAGAIYEDIVGALKGRYKDHQQLAAYRYQLKARAQLKGE
jgi:hypothetical protein